MPTTKPPRQKRLFATGYEPVEQTTPAPPHTGSDTSRAAAIAMKSKAGTQRLLVLQQLQHHPAGLTDDEMQDSLRLSGNSQRPRRRELQKAGLVCDSGRRRDGKIIWVAVDANGHE